MLALSSFAYVATDVARLERECMTASAFGPDTDKARHSPHRATYSGKRSALQTVLIL